jgi:hypothetical protein
MGPLALVLFLSQAVSGWREELSLEGNTAAQQSNTEMAHFFGVIVSGSVFGVIVSG